MWFASVQVGGIVLWLISRIDMRRDVGFAKQISCNIWKDIDLFRDCLRYCAGASLSQGRSFTFHSSRADNFIRILINVSCNGKLYAHVDLCINNTDNLPWDGSIITCTKLKKKKKKS